MFCSKVNRVTSESKEVEDVDVGLTVDEGLIGNGKGKKFKGCLKGPGIEGLTYFFDKISPMTLARPR